MDSARAVIFTESCRTQKYLQKLLEANGYTGQLALLNGSNSNPDSKLIYKRWRERHAGSDKISDSKTADMKAAIVEEFKDKVTILISTESGAEGVNMQFCSLLINYDLPWNPQRIEQRIGRIHRYGQKCDVVIVNFLNKGNKADERVFELLNAKLNLFDGIFGSSDEILGALESEISFEQRINAIYQKCRHADQIDNEFEQLGLELNDIIIAKEKDTRKSLLENFDEEVAKKLKGRREGIGLFLNQFGQRLRIFCQTTIPEAKHDEWGFEYKAKHYYYYDWKQADEQDGYFATIHCSLIAEKLKEMKSETLEPVTLDFDYQKYGSNLADIEPFIGKSGWMKLSKITMDSLIIKEQLTFCAITDDEAILDQEQCERLILVPSRYHGICDNTIPENIKQRENTILKTALDDFSRENEVYFDEEYEKLDRWAEDARNALDIEIKKLEKEIKEAKKQVRKLGTMQEKIDAKRAIKNLEKQRDKKRLDYSETCDQVDKQMDDLLQEMEQQMTPSHNLEEIFTIRWNLI